MLSRASATVIRITARREGAQEIEAVMADGSFRKAINFTQLTGNVNTGDRVTLNTAAVEMGLGTGGLDFVVEVNRGNLEIEPLGHIFKLRYTPLQLPVLAAEAPESKYHEKLTHISSLGGCPVVCCGLHSQVAAVCAGVDYHSKQLGRALRIAYIMTDESALPIAFSRLVDQLKKLDLLQATITCGQAFGGDIETINLPSALLAAYAAADADLIIVSQGPGNAGAGTPMGFSGIAQAEALHNVTALEGDPIAVLRISFADSRPRHYGLSHHSRTVLSQFTLVPVTAPLPLLAHEQKEQVDRALHESRILPRHHVPIIDSKEALQHLQSLLPDLTTMGRSIEQENAFFLSGLAAGILASERSVPH